jgi:hypothetical protein
MNILILGCGPAGLLAAHAAAMWGHDIKIVSKRRKSEMFGAQYLHKPIVDLDCGRSRIIKYELRGTPEGYRNKVYGPKYNGTVSPEELEDVHVGWNIRAAYDHLWEMYGGYVINELVSGNDLKEGGKLAELGADLVVSSIPAPMMCVKPEEHGFASEEVWAIGDAPERGTFDPIKAAEPNSVVCNGEPDIGWYRSANVFGLSTTEWPGKRRPPFEGVAQVVKPLKTTCDCFPLVMRVGRYGKWQKGVLSHTAFDDVYKKLDEPQLELF